MTGLNDMNLNNHFSDVNDQRTKVEQPQLAKKRALMDSHTKIAVMDTHEQTTAHLHCNGRNLAIVKIGISSSKDPTYSKQPPSHGLCGTPTLPLDRRASQANKRTPQIDECHGDR